MNFKTLTFNALPVLLCLLATTSITPVAMAQTETTPSSATSSAPLEISADKTLEWHRNTKQYIARGKAVAQQGDTTIAAETLTANYRETAEKSMDIYRLIAEENVILTSGINTAYGDHATYDIDTGMAVLTGNNLRMQSPEQTVTATDKFEYDMNAGRLSAIGKAKVVRGKDTLEAPTMSAFFASNTGADSSRKLERMEANGGVKITTPTEILTGDSGTYNAATNTATVIGNVRITRDQNVLEGDRATVNLTTNVSTLSASPKTTGGDGRVRGVFYPDQQKNKAEATQP